MNMYMFIYLLYVPLLSILLIKSIIIIIVLAGLIFHYHFHIFRLANDSTHSYADKPFLLDLMTCK